MKKVLAAFCLLILIVSAQVYAQNITRVIRTITITSNNSLPDITKVNITNIYQNQPCIIRVTVFDADDNQIWLHYTYENVDDSLLCNIEPGVPKSVDISVTYHTSGANTIQMYVNDKYGIGGGITLNVNVQSVTSVDDNSLPTEFTLQQNFPNPFNPTTTINYSIPEPAYVNLVVCDLLGREIKQLVGEYVGAGTYAVQFNASNLSSGTYLYRITAGKYQSVKKMVLLK